MSEKSRYSRKVTRYSSEDASLTSGQGVRNTAIPSKNRHMTRTSMSSSEISEDKQAIGNIEDRFCTAPDSDMVNVHQFFPALENNFSRAASGRLEEQRNLKTVVEEDDHSAASLCQGDAGSPEKEKQLLRLDDGQKDRFPDEGLEGSPRGDGLREGSLPTEDGLTVTENDSTQQLQENSLAGDSKESGSFFSTTVDEDMIQAAKERNHVAFTTDSWSELKTKTISLTDIVNTRAHEHYMKALQLQSEDHWVGAVTCLNKAISLKGDEAIYYRQRGEAFLQLCDFQSAILNYKKACLLASNDVETYQRLSFLFYFYGQCLFDQRQYSQALENFSKAAEMNPDNVSYHIRSINCLAALQRHGECLALVNRQLEADHNNPDLYVMRARLHQMFRNTTLCYYDVRDALDLDPDHQEAKQMILALEKQAGESKQKAVELNIAGKFREALQRISISIETNPSVAEYHVLRGAMHRKLNDFNAAIDDFLLALDKCGHDEESLVYANSQRQLLLTYNDFAVECFIKGFYEEAIILLNKAIKGEKNEKGLYVNRGDCFFKQGELNFALQDYHQALELDASDRAITTRISVIHSEFGVKQFHEKNYLESEAEFTLALQYNPFVGHYYVSRSRARYMLENRDGARKDLLFGLCLDPTNEDLLSILARLFPGKSVADVINSPAAKASYAILKHREPIGLGSAPQLHSPSGSTDVSSDLEGNSVAEEMSMEIAGDISFMALCMQEDDFNKMWIQEKQKVQIEVKDALLNRRSLSYQGARIQPLPPATSKPRYGSQLKGRVPAVSPAVSHKKVSYHWRSFHRGFGLLNT